MEYVIIILGVVAFAWFFLYCFLGVGSGYTGFPQTKAKIEARFGLFCILAYNIGIYVALYVVGRASISLMLIFRNLLNN